MPRKYIFHIATARSADALTTFSRINRNLYGIIAEVIGTLYGHNLGCDEPPSTTEMITHIFHLEQRLHDWRQGLPQRLTLHTADTVSSSEDILDRKLERFRLILSLRYLNLELLVHRPMLTSSLMTCSVSSGPLHTSQDSVNHMQTSFNKVCVLRAEDIIDIIHKVLVRPDPGRDLIGAWWFTLYYSMYEENGSLGPLVGG